MCIFFKFFCFFFLLEAFAASDQAFETFQPAVSIDKGRFRILQKTADFLRRQKSDKIIIGNQESRKAYEDGDMWLHKTGRSYHLRAFYNNTYYEYNHPSDYSYAGFWPHLLETWNILCKLSKAEEGSLTDLVPDCQINQITQACFAAIRDSGKNALELIPGWTAIRDSRPGLFDKYCALSVGGSCSSQRSPRFEHGEMWLCICGYRRLLRMRLGATLLQYNMCKDSAWGYTPSSLLELKDSFIPQKRGFLFNRKKEHAYTQWLEAVYKAFPEIKAAEIVNQKDQEAWCFVQSTSELAFARNTGEYNSGEHVVAGRAQYNSNLKKIIYTDQSIWFERWMHNFPVWSTEKSSREDRPSEVYLLRARKNTILCQYAFPLVITQAPLPTFCGSKQHCVAFKAAHEAATDYFFHGKAAKPLKERQITLIWDVINAAEKKYMHKKPQPLAKPEAKKEQQEQDAMSISC